MQRERANLVSQCSALVPEAARMVTEQKGKAQLESGIGFLFAARIDAAYVFNSSGDLRWSFRQNAAEQIDTDLLRRNFQKANGTTSKIINFPGGSLGAPLPLIYLCNRLTGDGSVLIALRFLPGELARNWDRLLRAMTIICSSKSSMGPLRRAI